MRRNRTPERCQRGPLMSNDCNLQEGDRVRAPHRDPFPDGTVLKLLDRGFVLIRWDSDVLETSHHRDVVKITTEEP